ncbi:MAG: M50 family metallopeptidase [Minicystis sp.]
MAFRLSNGSLVIGRFRGAPIRIHWSVPIGVLVFTGFRFAPGAWLGFVLVILLHELGHAIAVARCRQKTVAIDVHGFGGLCWWSGYPTPTERAIIAWGGVIAQAVLFLTTLVVLSLTGRPSNAFEADLVGAFLGPNLWNIALNLVPIPPLDGAEAWKILPILASRARKRREERAARARAKTTQRTLRSLDELDELPPMPDEVKRVLDRVMRDGRAQYEAEKKTK